MSHSYWPETNRLPDVSLANLGLFGISRELQGFPGGSVIKNLPANEGAVGSIPGLGRSSGAGNGNPIPALLPGESRRQSSLGGCRPRCYCSCRCCCSVTKSCRTLCNPGTAALQASLSLTIYWSLLKLKSIESVMPSNHLILCCPLLLLSQSFSASHWVFSNESALCFSISPFNEYSGLISCRIDWFDLLAVQGTLKSLLQYHNSKASILQHSAFFMVQLSHPYMTTGKIIALTTCTFVSKMMSLLFNTLSGFVKVFLPRSKRLLISWLRSLSAVILESKKIKSVTVSTFLLLLAMKC